MAKVATNDKKKPKKKKKKRETTKPGNGEEEEEEVEGGKGGGPKRTVFPWYHILAPLLIAIVTYKYSKPNLATSAVMTVALTAVVFF